MCVHVYVCVCMCVTPNQRYLGSPPELEGAKWSER